MHKECAAETPHCIPDVEGASVANVYCIAEHKLRRDYLRMCAQYFQAVRMLADAPSSEPLHLDLSSHAEFVHRMSREARDVLDGHCAEHGCGGPAIRCLPGQDFSGEDRAAGFVSRDPAPAPARLESGLRRVSIRGAVR